MFRGCRDGVENDGRREDLAVVVVGVVAADLGPSGGGEEAKAFLFAVESGEIPGEGVIPRALAGEVGLRVDAAHRGFVSAGVEFRLDLLGKRAGTFF